MKWIAVLAVVGAVGFFGYRKMKWAQAEEALLLSVCAKEIDAVAHAAVGQELMKQRDVPGSAVQGLKVSAEYKASSLAPHLPALHRMADASGHVAHVKQLAVVAAQRCPEAFPEAIKAEKPLGYTIQLSVSSKL